MKSEELDRLLRNNVLEIAFIKRDGTPRKMLCTKSYMLLNSREGAQLLHYYRPQNNLSYDPAKYNNVIVWDVQRENYRQINCDTVKILRSVTDEEYLKTARKYPLLGLDGYGQ